LKQLMRNGWIMQGHFRRVHYKAPNVKIKTAQRIINEGRTIVRSLLKR
jgi:hypothetical protein